MCCYDYHSLKRRPEVGDREETNGVKKRRIESKFFSSTRERVCTMYTATDDEKKDLEAVARISVCDSTSDDHDRTGPDGAELGYRHEAEEFREFMIEIAQGLSTKDTKNLRVIYLFGISQDIQDGTDLVETLMKRELLTDSSQSLAVFTRRLNIIGRMDLQKQVQEYAQRFQPSQSSEKTPHQESTSDVDQLMKQLDVGVAVEERDSNTAKASISGATGVR